MNEFDVCDVKLQKCPSCGAPIRVGPDDTAVQCEYCRSHLMIATSQSSPTAPTIIIETRRRHVYRHRLRRLVEFPGPVPSGLENPTGGEGAEE